MTDPTPLAHQKCVPCEGGTQPLSFDEVALYSKQLKLPWTFDGNKRMDHEFKFKDFKEAMEFVNQVAEIANGEGHHPDIHIYYNKVLIELWTHNIGGLSVNDFIMAVKIEALTTK